MAYRPRGHRKRRPARGKPSSFVWVTHPPAPAGCRVLHFELLATGPGSGHLSAHATGAWRDGLTLVGGKGKPRHRQGRPCRVLGPHGSGTLNLRQVASESHRPRPIQVASDMCSEGGRALSRPSCLSIPTQREVYGLRSSKIHTLLLLALLLEGNRGQKGKKTKVPPERHAAARTPC